MTGGSFHRTYDTLAPDGGLSGLADPATVSSFCLDKYEVTVGRFRQFVAAWNWGTGWRPAPGSGKHVHLHGGLGLVDVGAPPDGGTVYETGWIPLDDLFVEPTNENLLSNPGSWTIAPSGNENLPIASVSWAEAYAFCIWDGGFLPSETEWEYAAAGGAEQRLYPWGATDPGSNDDYAIYACNYPSPGCPSSSFAPVGTAAMGAGLWGQLDLAGNADEYTLDGYAGGYGPYVNPSQDGASLWSNAWRISHGGDYESQALGLQPWNRELANSGDWGRYYTQGFRCARPPAEFAGVDGGTDAGPTIDGSTGEAGSPVVVMLAGGAESIAVGTTDVYWTYVGACQGGGGGCGQGSVTGGVMSVPLDGGTAATIATTQVPTGDVAVDAAGLYFTEWASTGAIASAPLGGGAVTTFAGGQSAARRLAMDATTVYWADEWSAPGTGAIVKAARAGGSPVTLASGADVAPMAPVAIDATNVYWFGITATAPWGFAVMKTPIAGGSSVTLAVVQGRVGSTVSPLDIAVQGSSVYCTTYNPGTLISVPVSGGSVVTLASGYYEPEAIAVDATSVYWVTENLSFGSGAGAVMKMPLGGGIPVTIAPVYGWPSDIAVDATSVYWTDSGALMKATPK